MIKEMKINIHVSVIDFKYLDDFIEALANVGHEYYLCHDSSDTNSIKYMERVFAYEFYHQYRKIMEQHPCRYNGLYLGGEQIKITGFENHVLKMTPDIVLHGSFNKDCTGYENQKWLCEIKTKSNSLKYSDLDKLASCPVQQLGFDALIFLYIGGHWKSFQNGVKRWAVAFSDKNDGNTVADKIICICSNRTKDSLEIHAIRLGEILDKINDKKRLKVKG